MTKSSYTEKLFNGQEPDDRDWQEHLRAAHREVPGMSPRVFDGYRTRDGLNSYEILASSATALGPDGRVLDLACGDGHLLSYVVPKLGNRGSYIGVDMVTSEIELARKSVHDQRVRFLCEPAEGLSLPDGSVDLVLCHMALMLIRPIEPVLRQIRRALAPQGRVAAIIGGSRIAGSAATEIGDLVARFLKEHFPNMAAPRIGDARFSSPEGLRELFSRERGFSGDVRVDDFQILVAGDMDAIWDFYKDMYLVGILPEELKPRLRERIELLLKPRADRAGRVALEYSMRKFEAAAA